ncbi:MAG TPA: NADH-quinone oxidoreductase subunit NuoB [Thermoanaerobaculia bacterium]|nr:NADH-quinone oxidoreductase subunit NuoB [Thermoanaerobaculia bacterium]
MAKPKTQDQGRLPIVKAGTDSATTIGESWVTTTFENLEDWAQRNSFWPFPFGTACCAIEFMSTVSSHYDLARFGSEVVRFSPRQSDVLLVAGTINDKMAPVLKKIYDQMADPKWVISMGACACSGGFYRAYHVMQGIDEIIPVDVYVPGCPPTPEGLIYGILQLKEKVARDRRQLREQTRKEGESADLGVPAIG